MFQDNDILHLNNGPVARQAVIRKIEEEYDKERIECSIFYQVCSLYGIFQDRYFKNDSTSTEFLTCKDSRKENQDNPYDYKPDNELTKYINQYLKNNVDEEIYFAKEFFLSCNFLRNIEDFSIGYKKILEICQEFPKEWTILQVCKASCPQTTYSLFRDIHAREANIYLTVLKHIRSSEYPDPICIRFSDFSQIKMYELFAQISEKCKEYMQVDPNEVTTYEAKAKYWENLKILDKIVKEAIDELRAYIFPWIFVFRGVPNTKTVAGSQKYQKEAFAEVDNLCGNFNLKQHERVLLSLAAVHVSFLSFLEIEAISEELSNQKETQTAIQQLLQKLQMYFSNHEDCKSSGKSYKHTHFPLVLVVDEQLDHFFWEELNVEQEMCRVNSLQCLYKLYGANKHRIEKGYLKVGLVTGACVINPDKNLPKTQMRMGSFFKYWTPSWPLKLGEKATQEELLNDYFKRDCYFYAGHGSGLQHISGRRIIKTKIDAVVFLFGCDSTRMSSSGLFSDLMGTHFYYHAAMCPCIVGTILPALDAKMDEISVEILSRCVAPESQETVMWDQINFKLWTKEGKIERHVTSDKSSLLTNKTNNYHIASLCGALTRIHARENQSNFYNTVPYVCRGLPVWNSNLEPLPE